MKRGGEGGRGAPPAGAGQSARPTRVAGLRIVDAVFHRGPVGGWWRPLAGIGAALLVHGVALVWAVRAAGTLQPPPSPPPGPVVELTAPPPTPPPPPPPPARPPPVAARTPRVPRTGPPPPPAQAARIVAQEPDPAKPVDLGDQGFVTGTAQTYAGGYTASSGTNTQAVTTREVDPVSQNRVPDAPDRSRPVGLTDGDWTCPWPREADDQEIDEKLVVIRAVVRPDGSVASASAVQDPGSGFGPAAVACALRTRFRPALDRQGNAIGSTSPPIRVRFTR